MPKLKFAILGCGRISTRHVEALINNKEEAELVAVYDIIEELAADKKKQYETAIKDAVNEDREPLVNGEEGKKAIEIILRAYCS
jgi:predicted dehydrogenase